MNSLSWFLYTADALSSIRVTFLLFGLTTSVAGVAAWIAWGICRCGVAQMTRWSPIDKDCIAYAEAWAEVWRPFRKALPFGFALVIVGSLLPHRNTFYAIAASEMGERAFVQSEAVQGLGGDAMKALQQWIKRQIEPDKPRT